MTGAGDGSSSGQGRRQLRVRSPLAALALVLAVWSAWAPQADAQELTPRAYWPAPNGINVAVVGYFHAQGDVLFDPTIPLYGVDSEVDLAVFAYLRSLSLWGRSSNLVVELPYQWSTTQGILVDTPAQGSVSGFNDLNVSLSVNLLGAPRMTPQEFQAFRADPKPILGASLKVVAPTGKYDSNRLLNAGGNRWAVKAELGSILRLTPKWLLEIDAGAWFLGDDDEFIVGPREQDPILALQLHLVRRFKPGFWASFDANYFYGGRQTIDGRRLIDVQRNSRIGGTVVVPFKGRHAVKIGYAAGLFSEFGTDFDQFLVSYQVMFR